MKSSWFLGLSASCFAVSTLGCATSVAAMGGLPSEGEVAVVGFPITIRSRQVEQLASCVANPRSANDLELQGFAYSVCNELTEHPVVIEEATCDEADACVFEVVDRGTMRLTAQRAGTLHARFKMLDDEGHRTEQTLGFEAVEATVRVEVDSAAHARVLAGSIVSLSAALTHDGYEAWQLFTDHVTPQYTVEGEASLRGGETDHTYLTAGGAGAAVVTATIGSLSASATLDVVAETDLDRLELRQDDAPPTSMQVEDSASYDVIAVHRDGGQVTYTAPLIASAEGHCQATASRQWLSIDALSTGPCTVNVALGVVEQTFVFDVVAR